MISGYATSVGALIPLAAETSTDRLDVFSAFFFWALLAVVAFGIYTGSFNQNRLSRLVKEHKDYTGEFDEITNLLDRKKGSRVR
jgi:ABC-type transport system involved in cytochrome c biogenesis permease subunit